MWVKLHPLRNLFIKESVFSTMYASESVMDFVKGLSALTEMI